SISRQRGEALGRAACPHSVSDIDRYRLHPGLIEAACQVLHSCETIETAPAMEANSRTFVPFSIDAFELFGEKATHAFSWCHARLRELGESDVIADLAIFTDAGKLVAKLTGFHLRPITRDAVKATPAQS